MGKIKVYELAKELGLSNQDTIKKLKDVGVEVKSHLSSVEETAVSKLRGKTATKPSKEVKKDAEAKTQMHIIRRNIKVINTDGEKSQIDEISTNITGGVKKTHHIIDDKKDMKKGYSKEGLGVVKPRQNYDRRPKYADNRTSGVVITRNGVPVQAPDKKEENKEIIQTQKERVENNIMDTNTNIINKDIEENKTNSQALNKDENRNKRPYSNENNSNNTDNYNDRRQNRPYNKDNSNSYNNQNNRNYNNNNNGGYRNNNTGGYNNNNTGGYRNNNSGGYNNNNGGYRNNNTGGYNNNNNGGYRNNNSGGYNNNNNNNGGYRNNSTGGYNNNNNNGGYRNNNSGGYNNNNAGGYRNNNSGGYNNNNNGGYRNNNSGGYNNNNGGYRNNNSGGYNNGGYRQNGDKTSYQVNKFIKQESAAPVEQKETREYTNNAVIDRKKYNNDKNSNERKGLDKNKLREQHSRVDATKLKGLEVNSSSGLLDLYERDSDHSKRSRNRRKNQRQKVSLNQTKIIPMTEVKLPEIMTVKEFAERIKKQASEIIKKLFGLGIMATVNQDLDFDTAYLIAAEFGITAEKEVLVTEEDILFDDSEDDEKDLVARPPIVVVMGHVDHGKTSLLDRLRSAKVASGESGGITQHIGAYKVEINNKEICFLDTPGHEAFTAMRARGAQVTDIAIIVVAADDGIKPQTIEAIDHAKAAGVSIVVAINKIDKPTADIDKVKRELLEVGLVPEEWGGDTICVPISALTGEGIENLLEMLLLVAEMKNLVANPNKQAKGTVIEARLDKTKGTIVSMLVQRGELNVGDTIVVGDIIARVRDMKDDNGKTVKKVGPSTPVEILGFPEVPHTGDLFYEVENDKVAKQLVAKKKADTRRQLIKQGSKVTLDDLFGQIKEGKLKELNIIIKADVQGSVEALKESLEKISNDEVRVRILHASTGGVKESDVTLASVSNAIIIGFNVRPELAAANQAEKEKVDLRFYSIIYDAIDDVEEALKGLTPKKYKEVMHGKAEVRKIFKITNVGIVAGCYVKEGKIIRNTMVRLVRDSIVLLNIKIDSLKREKDDVKEVATGYECGIKLENYSDIKEGDVFECFEMVEEK